MMRRGVRAVLPTREKWHQLQEFAQKEVDQAAFRAARAADNIVAGVVGSAGEASKIDWQKWQSTITHTDLVDNLKQFHDEQTKILDAALKEDHAGIVKSQAASDGCWNLHENAVKSCEVSVRGSETIVANGAKALFISQNNPSISQVSQSEWLDVDQYWSAFVEKHQHYHNHLNSVTEDPESKEYDQKIKADVMKKFNLFDGKGEERFNNKLLYQRPSYEYYDLYRGILVEHMIFYLTKTGGDARFFPECMPHSWYCEIYDSRFKLYEVLQARRRQMQMLTLSRKAAMELHPDSLEEGGEDYYLKLMNSETRKTELQVARLMGNYLLFTDEYIPVQTKADAVKVSASVAGKFYSLGSDVHALFFKPDASESNPPSPSPLDAFKAFNDHCAESGRKVPIAYNAAMEVFCEILETRKHGLQGRWFNLPGESEADAFMRRLKKDDVGYEVYAEYVAELKARFQKKEVVEAKDVDAKMKEIEAKYNLETSEYHRLLAENAEDIGQEFSEKISEMQKVLDFEKV